MYPAQARLGRWRPLTIGRHQREIEKLPFCGGWIRVLPISSLWVKMQKLIIRGKRGWAVWAGVIGLWLSLSAGAQSLRYDSYRELAIPPDASLRIGPFYSELRFTQEVGYRYVTTSGEGADEIYDEERGEITKDGSDFPLSATLYSRNYVLLNPDVDLDIAFQFRFVYFPLDTQDDEWALELADQGAVTRFGDFTFRMMREGWFGGYSKDNYSIYSTDTGRGFSADIGSEIAVTEYLKARIYTRPSYGVEYLDGRGYRDYQTGEKYEAFQNTVGVDMDWLLRPDHNLGLSVDRTDTLPQGTNAVGSQESVIQRAQAVYEYGFAPGWMVGPRVGVISRDYPEGERGSQFQTDLEGFLIGDLTPFSTVRAVLGYSQVDLTDSGAYEEEGSADSVVGRISLRTQLAKKVWHSLGFSRILTSGYRAGVEQVDEYRYAIYASGEDTKLSLSTAFRDVTPELTTVNAYQSWVTQMTVTQPVGDFWMLNFSAAYDQRMNDESDPDGPAEEDPYLLDDYDTVTLVLGTAYQWTKRTTVSGYIQHVERMSDRASLEFERDMASLTLAWTYVF